MTKFVIDANVATKWLVAEPLSDRAIALLDAHHELVAPDLMPIELGNVLWKKVRAGDLTTDEAQERFASLGLMGVRVCPTSDILGNALDLAVSTGRSFYDSLYLALAIREGCELVTADERFANALRETPHREKIVWLGNVQPLSPT